MIKNHKRQIDITHNEIHQKIQRTHQESRHHRSQCHLQYGLGLKPKEYKKIAMQNPRDLEGWYEQVHWIANIDSCLGVQGHYGNGNQSQSEWDMEVDHLKVIEINAMTKEERE